MNAHAVHVYAVFAHARHAHYARHTSSKMNIRKGTFLALPSNISFYYASWGFQ
jgi:hypothetical protein